MQKNSNRYESMCRAAARAREARSERNASEEFIQQRFWSKVDKRGPNECWPWIAGVAGRGYGAFRIKKRKINAHRFAWESFNGPIPDGLFACHHCDNMRCCNPKHLFIGTPKDNVQDCIAKGRLNPPKGDRHGCRKLSESEVVEIRKRYIAGESTKELSKHFPVSHQTITNIIGGAIWKEVSKRVPCIVRKQRGENHASHKLTDESVIEMRNSYVPRKVTMQFLADKFGVDTTTVFGIIHKQLWKHI